MKQVFPDFLRIIAPRRVIITSFGAGRFADAAIDPRFVERDYAVLVDIAYLDFVIIAGVVRYLFLMVGRYNKRNHQLLRLFPVIMADLPVEFFSKYLGRLFRLERDGNLSLLSTNRLVLVTYHQTPGNKKTGQHKNKHLFHDLYSPMVPAKNSFRTHAAAPIIIRLCYRLITILSFLGDTQKKTLVFSLICMVQLDPEKNSCGDKDYVKVIDPSSGKTKEVEVQTGRTNKGEVVITKGLKPGDKIIVAN